jgi:hypothetical protein
VDGAVFWRFDLPRQQTLLHLRVNLPTLTAQARLSHPSVILSSEGCKLGPGQPVFAISGLRFRMILLPRTSRVQGTGFAHVWYCGPRGPRGPSDYMFGVEGSGPKPIVIRV